MLFPNWFFSPSSSYPNHPCVPSPDFYDLKYHWPHVRRPQRQLLIVKVSHCYKHKTELVHACKEKQKKPWSNVRYSMLCFSRTALPTQSSHPPPQFKFTCLLGGWSTYLREDSPFLAVFTISSSCPLANLPFFPHSFLYNPTMFRKIRWWRGIKSCCEGVCMKGTERSFRAWTSPQAKQRC